MYVYYVKNVNNLRGESIATIDVWSSSTFVAEVFAWIPTLTFGMLAKMFQQAAFWNIFLFCPENRFWHFMQIVSLGDNLHKIPKPIFWEI